MSHWKWWRSSNCGQSIFFDIIWYYRSLKFLHQIKLTSLEGHSFAPSQLRFTVVQFMPLNSLPRMHHAVFHQFAKGLSVWIWKVEDACFFTAFVSSCTPGTNCTPGRVLWLLHKSSYLWGLKLGHNFIKLMGPFLQWTHKMENSIRELYRLQLLGIKIWLILVILSTPV